MQEPFFFLLYIFTTLRYIHVHRFPSILKPLHKISAIYVTDCCFKIVLFFFFQFDVKLAKKKLDLFFYWPCRYMADVRLCCPVIFVYPVRLLRFEIRSRTSLLEYTQPAKHNHMMLLRKNCNKITRQIWKTNEIGFCCAPS